MVGHGIPTVIIIIIIILAIIIFLYYPFLAGQETNISFTYEEARQLLVLRKPAVNIAVDFTITISKWTVVQ